MRYYIHTGLGLLFFVPFLLKANSQGSMSMYTCQVGKPMPDLIIGESQGKKIRASDYQGKWLVLDFWNKYCFSCVKSFPETNETQREFKDKVQFILVGNLDPEGKITPMYKRFEKQLGLQLFSIFDSAVFQSLDIGACPYIVVVDPAGLVKAVTVKLPAGDLRNLMSGKSADLYPAFTNGQANSVWKNIDMSKPILVNNNGGADSDFVYRSLLSKYKPDQPYIRFDVLEKSHFSRNFFQVTGVGIDYLYQLAYGDTLSPFPGESGNTYGSSWPRPVLEVKDSSAFEVTPDFRTTYNYSVSFPEDKGVVSEIRRIMRNDLRNYFNYDVGVQIRDMPYWRITTDSVSAAKLRTKGGPPDYVGDQSGFNYKNIPMLLLIRELIAAYTLTPPFIDETGIAGNIDISVHAILSDFEKVRNELARSGLKIEMAKKKMKVVVIRDPLLYSSY
jgi:thiol-disulfide isomerase/thioredoxin